MFKLDLSDTFTWQVKVKFPIDGGQYREDTFDAKFKRTTDEETQAILAGTVKYTDREFCEKYFVGWDGVEGSDGKPLAFTPSTKTALLNMDGVPGAIAEAWVDAIKGARLKN